MITGEKKLEEKYAQVIKKHLPIAERERIIVAEFGASINTIKVVIQRERKVR
jgi:hypothetical protein